MWWGAIRPGGTGEGGGGGGEGGAGGARLPRGVVREGLRDKELKHKVPFLVFGCMRDEIRQRGGRFVRGVSVVFQHKGVHALGQHDKVAVEEARRVVIRTPANGEWNCIVSTQCRILCFRR